MRTKTSSECVGLGETSLVKDAFVDTIVLCWFGKVDVHRNVVMPLMLVGAFVTVIAASENG